MDFVSEVHFYFVNGLTKHVLFLAKRKIWFKPKGLNRMKVSHEMRIVCDGFTR